MLLKNVTTEVSCFWYITFECSRYTTLKQKYDLKVQEAELLQARLEQGSHHQQLEEIETLKNSIGTEC